ncbi:MAG TPA: hypothetical protein PL000_17445 [Anaerolineales bacterium]|nr:hypothetical protein [Anaerolineales bacterium]HNJ02609.1 hypothetical protein [Leptospiraceae bacterium]
MNIRAKLKTAIINEIANSTSVDSAHISKFRDRPVDFSEMPFVVVSSMDEPADRLDDLHTYKMTSQILITVYTGGVADPEEQSDLICGEIEDALLNPLCELIDTDTGDAIGKSLTLIGTKVRRQERAEKTAVFAAMLFECEAYAEIS